MGTGPVEVAAVCEAVLGELAAAFPASEVSGSLAAWAGVLGSLQEVIDTACAVQDAAIVHLAAIEPAVLEDGTIAETHRALGHAALDAPAIVSGALNVSAVHAESRVRAALRMAADGPEGTSTATGLGGLHQAMATGRLDTYRAGVIADELVEAPAEVAATVVAALDGYFGSEDAAHLRRRCRRVLTRISPDLLVQRARRAREQCGLRRWADEPGVDRWLGTFPSEEAAHAWAAIDALAHQYLTHRTCPNIERARAKALTDLVAGNATIDTILTVTVPATALPETVATETVVPEAVVPDNAGPAEASSADEGDLVEVTGPNGAQPVYVARSWLTTTIEQTHTTGKTTVQVALCHPATGALLDDTTPNTTTASGTHAAAATGPSQAPDHGDPPPADHRAAAATAPSQARNLDDPSPVDHRDGEANPMRDDNDGLASGLEARDEPMLGDGDDVGHDPRSDHTGAHQPPAAMVRTDRSGPYRPTPRMATRIKTRDRRCRFPGCTISADFCDIDHVTPWPHAPTHDTNLLCLCRRHHRIKQRPRWSVTLTPDGTATWTDPTGRVRTTHPANALHTSVLPHVTRASTAAVATNTSRARTVLPDGPHSALEFHLEHHIAPPPGHPPRPVTLWRDQHGRHRAELLPIHGTTLHEPTSHPTEHWPCRHTRHRPQPHDHDPPPF